MCSTFAYKSMLTIKPHTTQSVVHVLWHWCTYCWWLCISSCNNHTAAAASHRTCNLRVSRCVCSADCQLSQIAAQSYCDAHVDSTLIMHCYYYCCCYCCCEAWTTLLLLLCILCTVLLTVTIHLTAQSLQCYPSVLDSSAVAAVAVCHARYHWLLLLLLRGSQ
jgi:hypothetical protein